MNEQYEEPTQDAAIFDKLTDILTPGYEVEFDPIEAELAGAFIEDALNEGDAAESGLDHFEPPLDDDGVSHGQDSK